MSISANDLLRQHPQEVRTWLEGVLAGRQIVPTNFNWLGLAEGLAFEATNPVEDREPADRIATAQTAIAVYDHLAHTLDPDGRDSYEHSAMMLRAAMIAQLGEAASHPVLGLGPVRNWFFERLTLSCDEALAMAADWTKQPIDIIRQLRRLKNRLSVLKLLADAGYFGDDEEIAKWVQIQDRLP